MTDVVAAPSIEVDGLRCLLNNLLGRVDDGCLAATRVMLGEGWTSAVASAVIDAMMERGAPLSPGESGVLDAVLLDDERGHDLLAVLVQPVRVAHGPRLQTPAHADQDSAPDLAETALMVEMAGDRTAIALWRAEREDALQASSSPSAVWLLESAVGDPLAAARLGARAVTRLAGAGVAAPSVLVATTADPPLPVVDELRRVGRRVWLNPTRMRVARVYDRVDDLLGPSFDLDHRRLEGVRRDQVLDHLLHAAVVARGSTNVEDVFAPKGDGIDNVFRTDGQWVWHHAVAHHLLHQGLAPEPALLAHIESARDGLAVPVDRAALVAAVDALREGPSPAAGQK